MGLQQFERRLERLVEGAFGKAFRSGLQPVEIGRRLVRELEAARTLGVRGTVAPNQFTVLLAEEDLDRFASFHEALARELVETAREHAREEEYHFVGPVAVDLVPDPRRRRGDLRVVAEIAEGEGGGGSLALPDGRRIPLRDEPMVIGRLPECAVPLTDPQVSRHHAEIHPGPDGFQVVDLGSTNGTFVNDVPVREHSLVDGDEVKVGSTVLRFEEA